MRHMGNIVKHNEVYNLPCVTFVRVNVSYGNVLKIVFCTRRMKMMVSVSTAHDRPLWTRVLLQLFLMKDNSVALCHVLVRF